MTEVAEKITEATARLDEDLSSIRFLNILSSKTGISKTYILTSAILTFFTLAYVTLGPNFICNATGFFYPTYASFHAIESKRKDDDTQWLTYWVVYALFTVVEAFVDVLLFWFPFYYSFKFGFLIWLFLPSTQGAKFLYQNVVKGIVATAEDFVDQKFNTEEIKQKEE
eukprot:snap_masked-scaffold_8-processed-gene-12.39-mRNA-1 protein AED:0.39 eAED:0.39 QI:0/-1/0/1/-1/1/1/0/167